MLAIAPAELTGEMATLTVICSPGSASKSKCPLMLRPAASGKLVRWSKRRQNPLYTLAGESSRKPYDVKGLEKAIAKWSDLVRAQPLVCL